MGKKQTMRSSCFNKRSSQARADTYHAADSVCTWHALNAQCGLPILHISVFNLAFSVSFLSISILLVKMGKTLRVRFMSPDRRSMIFSSSQPF